MKISRIFAGVSACAVAALSMAVSASAAEVVVDGSYTIDSGATPNYLQLNLADVAMPAEGLLTQIKFDCVSDWATAGWVGGGGAVAMNYDGGDTWYQVDFEPASDAAANWTAVIDVAAEYNESAQDIQTAAANGGVFQIGWWWGADATLDVSNITFVFEDAQGDVTTTTAAVTTTTVAETTTTAAETTTTAVETTTTVAETTTAAETTTTTSATTAADTSPSTGVEGVASIVALLTLAGAAVAVAKKH